MTKYLSDRASVRHYRLFAERWLLAMHDSATGCICFRVCHSKKITDEAPVKREWNNVHFGPAKYDRETGGFEDPWPFGPGP